MRKEIFMMTAASAYWKTERGDAHEEIKKQIAWYGAEYRYIRGNVQWQIGI